VSPALANFLFEAANFLLLVAALGWVLFKPIRRALDAERDRYAKQEEEAKRLRAEAEALAKDTRAARETAEREIQQTRRDVLAAAQKEAKALLEAARATERTERQAFEQELTARREAEMARLAESVGRVAAESVRQLLDVLAGPSLDAALIRAACAELAAFPVEIRRSALIESARPLDAEARSLLVSVLGDGIRERVVDELGAGVRVTTSAGAVDATSASLARRAAHAVSALGAPTEGTSHADRV
jgi:F-type H+-transporting ATPase subunit b